MSTGRRKPPIWRQVASLLAVTGLLGHGIAMLLVALLVPPPAAAAGLYYGEICSAAGGAGEDEPTPRHPVGGPDACPVCSAFAHAGQGDLPPALPPLCRTSAADSPPAPKAEPPEPERLAASPRAPPAA